MKYVLHVFSVLTLAGALLATACSNASQAQAPALVPAPKAGLALAKTHALETAVFAGGCFWGIEAVFEHVRGVKRVRSGYAGGSAGTANYQAVGSGRSGHAESVSVEFDPAVVSYGQLLHVFFAVAHDPTQLNGQHPDSGPQYRSAIFSTSPAQERIARAYLQQLAQAKSFGAKPVVTTLGPLVKFFPAEAYHQDFARLNPDHPYIRRWDAPKVVHLQRQFPALYRADDVAVVVGGG